MRNVPMRAIIIGLLFGLGLVGARAQSNPTAAVAAPRIFTVASVAYRDLEKKLKGQVSSSTTKGISASESEQYSHDVRNYNIELMEYGERINVTFSLRPFKGRRFAGGVFHYVLNGTTGEILEEAIDR